MNKTVLGNKGQGEFFQITTGIKQGSVIVPTLFFLFIGATLHIVEGHLPPGVKILYRFGGDLFNLNRLRAKTKVCITSIIELQYEDNNVMISNIEKDLQVTLNAFNQAYRRIGLEINFNKMQILHQNAPVTISQAPNITLNHHFLQNVEHYPYLGIHLSANTTINNEIRHRLRCIIATFGRLLERIFINHDINAETKLRVYNAIIITTLT